MEANPGEDFLLNFYPPDETLPQVMETEFPTFPAIRMAGRFIPVVGVDVNRPYYIFGGKKVYVREDQEVLFLPVSHFARGFVDLNISEEAFPREGDYVDLSRSETEWVRVPQLRSGASRSLVTSFEVIPDDRLRRAFAVLVFYDDNFNRKLFWRQLGNLRQGQTKDVKLITDPIPRDGSYPHNFILVFSVKGEHKTSRRIELGKILSAMDLKWTMGFHQHYIKGNPGVDLPAFPIHRGNMMLPLDYILNSPGGTVRVRLTVDEFGYVKDPVIDDGTDEILNNAALVSLMTWKFFPGLRNGSPKDTKVRIPLVFRGNPRNTSLDPGGGGE